MPSKSWKGRRIFWQTAMAPKWAFELCVPGIDILPTFVLSCKNICHTLIINIMNKETIKRKRKEDSRE